MTDARKIIAGHIRWYTLGGDADVREADAIISALAAAGFAIVPKDPTDKMLKAGIDASEHQSVSRIYFSMIGAASDE